MNKEQEKEVERITKILAESCSPELFEHLHDALLDFYMGDE